MTDKISGPSTDSIRVSENLKEIKDHGDFEYPVGVYEVNMKNMYMETVRWHWHDELEMILIHEGCGKLHVRDDSYILSEGQGLFVNQGMLHSFSIAEGSENCIYSSVVFHPSFLFSYSQTKLCSIYLHPVISNHSLAALPLSEDAPYEKDILNLLQQIIQINRERQYCYELYTKDCLMRLWIVLLERYISKNGISSEAKDSRISMDEARAKEAIRFIEEHYADPISLDDIAASIHVSRSECCRCIRRCMKMTPFEYLMKYRIFIAAGLLCDRDFDDSLATLASRVGFNSSSYFNKLFKKYMNCTPTQYKARQLAKAEKTQP